MCAKFEATRACIWCLGAVGLNREKSSLSRVGLQYRGVAGVYRRYTGCNLIVLNVLNPLRTISDKSDLSGLVFGPYLQYICVTCPV